MIRLRVPLSDPIFDGPDRPKLAVIRPSVMWSLENAIYMTWRSFSKEAAPRFRLEIDVDPLRDDLWITLRAPAGSHLPALSRRFDPDQLATPDVVRLLAQWVWAEWGERWTNRIAPRDRLRPISKAPPPPPFASRLRCR